MPDWMETDWIQTELRRRLRPVAAPDELWDRIHRPVLPKQPVRAPWLVPVFAGMLVLLSAGLLWGIRQSRTHGFAGRSLASSDPARIRDWVKSNGAIDIELSPNPSGSVQLLGAKLIELRGAVVAAVEYRVGGRSGTLLVSHRTECCSVVGGSKHSYSKSTSAEGANSLSWDMREQTYTIAYAGGSDPQSGCLLCHAGL